MSSSSVRCGLAGGNTIYLITCIDNYKHIGKCTFKTSREGKRNREIYIYICIYRER